MQMYIDSLYREVAARSAMSPEAPIPVVSWENQTIVLPQHFDGLFEWPEVTAKLAIRDGHSVWVVSNPHWTESRISPVSDVIGTSDLMFDD